MHSEQGTDGEGEFHERLRTLFTEAYENGVDPVGGWLVEGQESATLDWDVEVHELTRRDG